ncbi:chondroitin sulfate N-acetylgalactosaminyltransferase 1-like [Homarus americanus]|uniref:chondroitin sulfate N-acetylgalactosaminyltransferase 1-like n=1 Tax=Homarus americanus TaxID=6706 RepID=UPI001C491637|nr:chondroitin sulfate N-acetylgalactosaminyltransferase 1-like [Homarus americanus]
MLARMKKGPCCGVVLAACFCFLYVATGTWPLSGGGPWSGDPTSTSFTDQQQQQEDLGYTDDSSLPLNYPHPTETLNDGLSFRYFDTEVTFQTEGVAGRLLTQHEHALLTSAKEAAKHYLTQLHPNTAFVSGRYRWLPDGVEYDLIYKDEASDVTSRVTLFQKLEATKVLRSITVDQKTVVNMVVTLKGRVAKYATFLDHLVKNVLPYDHNLSLTVVYFSDDFLDEAREVTSSRLSSLPNFKWSFIPLEERNFSRGRGLHIGAQQKDSKYMGELLFFCDVDVLMHSDFFSRCRSNTKKGHQVYYPVVFSLYNPKLVYPLFDKKVPPVNEQLAVDEQSGFWRTFGFGMACMFRDDYHVSGGFPDIRTWGGEDVALYQQFLKLTNIKVIRAPDPSLFHLYHHKDCMDTGSSSYVACLKSKAVTEGSQLQLGLSLLKLHQGTDLEGVLSKRFYYFWLVPYLGLLLAVSLLTNLTQAVLLLLNRRVRYFRTV